MTAPEKPCEACEKVRGQTLSEEAWEIAVLDNHHSLYQVAQLGLAVANAALSERDALIRALEERNRDLALLLAEAVDMLRRCGCGECEAFNRRAERALGGK